MRGMPWSDQMFQWQLINWQISTVNLNLEENIDILWKSLEGRMPLLKIIQNIGVLIQQIADINA